jgi:hypothetical protein
LIIGAAFPLLSFQLRRLKSCNEWVFNSTKEYSGSPATGVGPARNSVINNIVSGLRIGKRMQEHHYQTKQAEAPGHKIIFLKIIWFKKKGRLFLRLE